jgi:hypothetical protein
MYNFSGTFFNSLRLYYIYYDLKGTIRSVLASVLVLKISRKIAVVSTLNRNSCRNVKLTFHGRVSLTRIVD